MFFIGNVNYEMWIMMCKANVFVMWRVRLVQIGTGNRVPRVYGTGMRRARNVGYPGHKEPGFSNLDTVQLEMFANN